MDLEITGLIEIHIFASTSARDTDYIAKLPDVFPNSRAYSITDGIVWARYRNSVFQPEVIFSGQVYEFCTVLSNISWLFKREHRSRIDICSSNFSVSDCNMNTGNPVGEDSSRMVTEQKLFQETACESCIDLPIAGIIT